MFRKKKKKKGTKSVVRTPSVQRLLDDEKRRRTRGSSLVLIPSTTHRGGSQMWDRGWNDPRLLETVSADSILLLHGQKHEKARASAFFVKFVMVQSAWQVGNIVSFSATFSSYTFFRNNYLSQNLERNRKKNSILDLKFCRIFRIIFRKQFEISSFFFYLV